MKRSLQMSAVTKSERHEATALALEMINRLGGWVEDTQFFSNKMITIRYVLPQGVVQAFVAALEQADIHVSFDGEFRVSDPAVEQPGSLQMTFIHNEPDLKRTIPAIPG